MRIHQPGVALVVLAAACSSPSSASERNASASRARPNSLVCDGVASASAHQVRGNPAGRRAAQHGLGYLTEAATRWTASHNCFGCHVQAVTMEALTVGMHHQYDVGMKDVDAMASALEMGVTAGGRVTGAAFQGQAWARYDRWVNSGHTGELLRYAAELVGMQQEDGSIPDDDARRPVTGGTMHTTYQGMQTWRQAYARTADDKWLTPMRRAEAYLVKRSAHWGSDRDVYLQDVNFALLGLVAAGVGAGEQSSMRLQRQLLSRQHQDGGWGLDEGTSDALATGQTLYALRLAGHGDGEAAIDRATTWLIDHQRRDGAWRTVTSGQGGADKGEAMWAVLGLVSLDVTSVAVKGLTDGQRVAPVMTIGVEAKDNQAGGIAKVELVLDDRPLTGACGDRLTYAWNTMFLADGKHTLDVIATTSKQQVSRRRYEVYAGNVFLTEVGTRFLEAKQATELALRDLAPGPGGTVEVAIFATDVHGARATRVHAMKQASQPGAMTFAWTGVGDDGKPQPRGRYVAELSYVDATGTVRQKTEAVFVHDTEAAARAGFAEIEGQLGMAKGGTSANTELELVDERGEVVQRTRSTAQGNYRFKGVAGGSYKVRAKKQGFWAKDAEVKAAPAAPPAKANLDLR